MYKRTYLHTDCLRVCVVRMYRVRSPSNLQICAPELWFHQDFLVTLDSYILNYSIRLLIPIHLNEKLLHVSRGQVVHFNCAKLRMTRLLRSCLRTELRRCWVHKIPVERHLSFGSSLSYRVALCACVLNVVDVGKNRCLQVNHSIKVQKSYSYCTRFGRQSIVHLSCKTDRDFDGLWDSFSMYWH